MSNTFTKPILRGIQLQWIVLLAVAIVFWMLLPRLLLSVLAGGFIASLAHIWFSWRVFHRTTEEAGQILGTVYRAEVGKIGLTVMLFIAAFVMIKPLSVVSLMAAYLITTWIPSLASYLWADDSKPGNTGELTNVR